MSIEENRNCKCVCEQEENTVDCDVRREMDRQVVFAD